MMKGVPYVVTVAILALAFSLASAYDPSPLQDFCVAINNTDSAVFVNGKFCKDPATVTANDFFFSGLNIPGNTAASKLGSSVNLVNVDKLPGLNTLGISLARLDFAPYGLNPPHTHPRGTELLVVMEGTLLVGFVTSNPNKLFTKVLNKGDVFVFPIGLIHFQFNIGQINAVALAGLSSQNPGLITIANALSPRLLRSLLRRIQLNFFDAASSSTAALVPCSDPMCTSALQSAATICSSQNNQCSYSFQYGDGSGTSGYYVSDTLYFDMVLGQSSMANSSAPIVFGCSTYQSGDLTKTDKAVDGIFGFGQGDLSVISQLSSRGITPKVFSHCLKGDGNGGGILVLGEILEPSIAYSPLVPSQPHYNLYLQSIAVNGQLLPIDPSVFATSNNRGTIVDSGTTLAYLVAEAYDPFVSSITANVQQSVTPIISKGNQCYLVSTSGINIFPQVSLNFAGASMVLKPEEYLVHLGFTDGAAMWCIGFQRVQEGVTILGDLVLKDKIFVYDLARQRIGWANYDCSLSVNVSITSGKEYLNAGQLSVSSSTRDTLFALLPTGIIGVLFYTLVLN